LFLRENEVGHRIAPHLRPGWTMLDLGAGTGRLARWLAQRSRVVPTLADLVPYGNRRPEFPFIQMDDPCHVPAPDRSFDVVLLLFALHHNPRELQGSIVAEAARVAGRRVVIAEDTALNRGERMANVAWDKVLNLRHGVPTPFSFRSRTQWLDVFASQRLSLVHVETYRPLWPTLGTYHHTLFVLDHDGRGD
jgi:ubiquinone/menaquinone biosynthesis C-methylase UbiE